MVRCTVQILASVFLIFASQFSRADDFEVAMHVQDGANIPFLHPPGTNPGGGMCFSLSEPENVLKPKRCRFEDGGLVLSVEYVCINRCNYWRTSLEFAASVLYRPLDYEYPGFVESAWYVDFWNKVRTSECAAVVNEAKVRPRFWASFINAAPKSYADLLKQDLGLEKLPDGGTAGAVMNVQPGMRLRLENAVWQDVTKTDSDETAAIHRGYVGTGVSYLMVNRQSPAVGDSNQNEFLSFEPFFGHVKSQFGIPANPASNLGSGVIDPHLQTQRYFHFRLFVPSIFSASSGTAGDTLIDHYPLLIAAPPDKTELLKASDLSQMLQNTTWGSPLDPGTLIYSGFRGRSAVIPEVMVSIHGDEQYVSVATTLRQVLDRYGKGDTLEELRGHACLQRNWHGKMRAVHFCGKSEREYDLPLSRGDRLPCSP